MACTVRADEAHQQELERQQWLQDYGRDSFNEREVDKMDATKYAASDSPDLKAKDFIGKNFKVVISGVTEKHFEANDKTPACDRLRLTFEGKDKGVVLNPTNTEILCKAYGVDTDEWVEHEISLTVMEYDTFQPGWIVQPLDVAVPDFDDDIPF